MAFKRLIGVIPVKDGRVVKSYGYRFWRPAGDLVTAMQNLDRWNVDEILVMDISRQSTLNVDLLHKIKKAKISTPLTYGGGIRSPDDVAHLMDAGCERFVLETLIFDQPDMVRKIADIVGAQALIGSLPLVGAGGSLRIDPAYSGRFRNHPDKLSGKQLCAIYNDLPIAELMITAMDREGYQGQFDVIGEDGRDDFLVGMQKGLIWFGGLSPHQASMLLKNKQTIAVAFANINTERELAISGIRKSITDESVLGMVRTVHTR